MSSSSSPWRSAPLAVLACAWLLASLPPHAAAQAAPPASAAASSFETRQTSLPAKGLFAGDQLSAAARQKLTELIVDALGLRVEVALVVPTGPWQLDGLGGNESELTPARLDAVKRFLAERGVDPKHIYVESRIDEQVGEPRLDVQIGGRAAND